MSQTCSMMQVKPLQLIICEQPPCIGHENLQCHTTLLLHCVYCLSTPLYRKDVSLFCSLYKACKVCQCALYRPAELAVPNYSASAVHVLYVNITVNLYSKPILTLKVPLAVHAVSVSSTIQDSNPDQAITAAAVHARSANSITQASKAHTA